MTLLTTLYKSHVYVIVLLLYTSQRAHPQKFSFRPSPCSRFPLPLYPQPSFLVTTIPFSVATCLVRFGSVCSSILFFVQQCILDAEYTYRKKENLEFRFLITVSYQISKSLSLSCNSSYMGFIGN